MTFSKQNSSTAPLDDEDAMTLKDKLMELGYLGDNDLNRDGIPHEAVFEALASFQDDQGIEDWG